MEQDRFDVFARFAGTWLSRRTFLESATAAALAGTWGRIVHSAYAAISCPGKYKARYWNNTTLSGRPAKVRCEPWPINHNWGSNVVPAQGVRADYFSARWTGRAHINAGTYAFTARGDDGIRVWLNGQRIIDQWSGALPEIQVTRHVPGGNYAIRVDFREFAGDAIARFRWDRATACTPLTEICDTNGECCGYPSRVCGIDVCYAGAVCCVFSGQPCSRDCDCCDPLDVIHVCIEGTCQPRASVSGQDATARTGDPREPR